MSVIGWIVIAFGVVVVLSLIVGVAFTLGKREFVEAVARVTIMVVVLILFGLAIVKLGEIYG